MLGKQKLRWIVAGALTAGLAVPASAQIPPPPGASLSELAATPIVRVNIAESLRTPPDEAGITVGTQSRAPTATQATADNRAKTERLLATIRRSGLRERDIQTQGIQLQPEYEWVQEPGVRSGRQVFRGYLAANSIQLKTRDIARLAALLDTLVSAGADSVYGPTFAIADPLPLRAEARRRALARGEAEAMEYARSQGFTRVKLLSVEEGTSFRASDIVVTGSRVGAPPPPPPPPAAMAERDAGGGIVAPGQIETGVALNLLYRMER